MRLTIGPGGEVNITRLFNELVLNPHQYADSIAHSGLENIGQITWNRALSDARFYSFSDYDQLIRAIEYRMCGCWKPEELGLTQRELRQEAKALFLQMLAGDIWEGGLERLAEAETDAESDAIWADYEDGVHGGCYSGDIFRADGKVYYSLGF